MTVQEMKERLIKGDVKSYQWIPTKEMWSDGLTKEMEMAEGLRKLLKTGNCEIKKEELNKVVCESDEIKMVNIRNRRKTEEEGKRKIYSGRKKGMKGKRGKVKN